MKEKIQTLDYKRKIQLLTLTPESWSRKFASNYFEVTEHAIRKARKMKHENGILSIPSNKIGRKLLTTTTDLLLQFYEDDEYSRMMPGRKDYVSVGKGIHKQKRLLLCNLRELYSEFKVVHPEINVGFSMFCSLRPKWCVSVGAAGTHSVCVCVYHQNAILLTNALKWNLTYKDLMAKVFFIFKTQLDFITIVQCL
jgi:hypothetical protein